MSNNKMYQVFVSSTYEDLKDERNKVLQALLRIDCIPIGMEYFNAADEDQFTVIKDLISSCDYYVLFWEGNMVALKKKVKKVILNWNMSMQNPRTFQPLHSSEKTSKH